METVAGTAFTSLVLIIIGTGFVYKHLLAFSSRNFCIDLLFVYLLN